MSRVGNGQIGHEEICQRRSSQNEQSAGSTSSRNWRACSTHSTQSWSDCVALSEPFSLTVVIVSSSSEAREGPATPFHLQSDGATWPFTVDQQRREQAPLSSEGVEERSWDGWEKRVLSVRVERRSSVPASAEASSPTHHRVEASQPTFCGVDNRERQRSRSCSTCTRNRGPTWRGRAK